MRQRKALENGKCFYPHGLVGRINSAKTIILLKKFTDSMQSQLKSHLILCRNVKKYYSKIHTEGQNSLEHQNNIERGKILQGLQFNSLRCITNPS